MYKLPKQQTTKHQTYLRKLNILEKSDDIDVITPTQIHSLSRRGS